MENTLILTQDSGSLRHLEPLIGSPRRDSLQLLPQRPCLPLLPRPGQESDGVAQRLDVFWVPRQHLARGGDGFLRLTVKEQRQREVVARRGPVGQQLDSLPAVSDAGRIVALTQRALSLLHVVDPLLDLGHRKVQMTRCRGNVALQRSDHLAHVVDKREVVRIPQRPPEGMQRMHLQTELQIEGGQRNPIVGILAQFHRPLVSRQPRPDIAGHGARVAEVIVQVSHARVGRQQRLQQVDGLPGLPLLDQTCGLSERPLQLCRWLARSPVGRRPAPLPAFPFTQMLPPKDLRKTPQGGPQSADQKQLKADHSPPIIDLVFILIPL